ncbi:beta-propeller domain-containing protein [Aliiglaciecola sp. CAU 1673]|uniref:beta-propeller domain-containing protein n=1 Tax=Aliiglaciecola sp. CAU 1673 TaxID=3032595 RepID=UPI0023DA763D|nr:beta-propeller domain-containing protein [Aliiglaciecola sp. CAU 1673]MDF2179411.1 beta-propeller domain-containing protein [Aliiglaciecola sp. CAU 1673]
MKTTVTLSLLSTACVLAACGGGSDVSAPKPTPPAVQLAPEVNPPAPISGALVQPGLSTVSRFIKNGLYGAGQNPVIYQTAIPEASDSRSAFSTTTTQEGGVDEADRMEYDGNYLYVAEYPVWTPDQTEPQPPYIRVLKRQDDFSLNEVNRLTLDEADSNINGIYQHTDRVAVVASGYPMMMLADIRGPFVPSENKVDLTLFNTADPEQATKLTDVEIDGWLLSSRRIGDDLYLVTSHYPQVAGLEIGSSDNDTRWRNYNLVQAQAMADLMPKISINGQSQPLHNAEDCFIPKEAEEKDGSAQIISITKVNLAAPSDIQSLCMVQEAEQMYMSIDSLYLTATLKESTQLHKISLSNFTYAASGEVDGTLGWQANPYLRLSEFDGNLRIMTSHYGESISHHLSVLTQQGQELVQISRLPNEQQPEAIGKPGEDIYAVRYMGNKGYVVTFERIDPLYVLDLSDPTQPSIAGSLEIPGFSSYLHPLENGYLLGIGQEVSIESLPDGNGIPVDNPVRSGVKVSLFDVRDPANPKEVGTLVKGDGYTPVEYDYKALTVLQTDNGYRFAMPLEQWQSCEEVCTAVWQPRNSLLMLDVDTTADGSLTELRQLEVKQDEEYYFFGGNDRSVIHGDHLYYIHGNSVWHSQWQADAEITGPY